MAKETQDRHKVGSRRYAARVSISNANGQFITSGVYRSGHTPLRIMEGSQIWDSEAFKHPVTPTKSVIGHVTHAEVVQCADGWWYYEATCLCSDGMPVYQGMPVIVSEVNTKLLSIAVHKKTSEGKTSRSSGKGRRKSHSAPSPEQNSELGLLRAEELSTVRR